MKITIYLILGFILSTMIFFGIASFFSGDLVGSYIISILLGILIAISLNIYQVLRDVLKELKESKK